MDLKGVLQSQAFFTKTPVRDGRCHIIGYQLSFLTQSFCFRLCVTHIKRKRRCLMHPLTSLLHKLINWAPSTQIRGIIRGTSDKETNATLGLQIKRERRSLNLWIHNHHKPSRKITTISCYVLLLSAIYS